MGKFSNVYKYVAFAGSEDNLGEDANPFNLREVYGHFLSMAKSANVKCMCL
jgi:hypothetical protein